MLPSPGASGDRAARQWTLTQTGALVGTPAYMSPEQFEGKVADARSDQFSFCVALHEALLGKRPFAGGSFAELSTNVCAGRLHDRQALGTLRASLRRALERGLQTDPAARFGSMAALLAAIEPPRRRRIAPVLGAAAIAGVSAWALAEIDDEPPCDRGASRIDAVWNDALLRRTEAAFAATDVPYRDDTLASTRAALDAYAAAWRDVYIDACEAHRRGEQSADLLDRRMACLEDRREAMRAIVEVLVEADAPAVERAPEAARALAGVSACNDIDALREAVPPPPPEIAADVEAVRAQVANAHARASLGHPREALTPARDAWERAQQIDYAPLKARAAFVLAETEEKVDPSKIREDLYADAFASALEGRDDRSAATIVLFMLETMAKPDRARTSEAHRWTRVAEALVARLAHDPEVQLQLLHSKGLLARERGDVDDAYRLAAEELELAIANDRPGREMVAVASSQLGHMEFQRGDYARALELFEDAVQRDIVVHGARHPSVMADRMNVAGVLLAQGRYADALEHLRVVVSTRETLYGADSPQLLSSLENLSIALSGAGEVEEAIVAMERALRIAQATYGDGDPKTEQIRDLTGTSYFQAGRLEEARQAYETAVAALSAQLPATDRTLALVRYNLGEVLLELGRVDDAARETMLAHEGLASTLGPEHPYLGYTLTLLGRIALARQDNDAAARWLDQALALRDKAQSTALERAATQLHLALALRTTDPSRSASLLAKARPVIENDPSPDAARLRKHLE